MLVQHERPTSTLHAVSQLASKSPAAQLTTPDTVKARLTPKRPRRQVENDDYAAFIRRILRACSRRIGDGDIEALVLMLDLAEVIDTAMYLIAAELDRCISGSRAGSGMLIPIHKLSPRKGNRTLSIWIVSRWLFRGSSKRSRKNGT